MERVNYLALRDNKNLYEKKKKSLWLITSLALASKLKAKISSDWFKMTFLGEILRRSAFFVAQFSHPYYWKSRSF